MEIGRKKLPHELPPGVMPNPEFEVYFITICCEPRGLNQLALPEVWQAICETMDARQSVGDIRVSLMLAMPDHLHALIAFPGRKPMEKVIGNVKAWLAKSRGIEWQSGFFDHRLRSWESAEEKRRYILNNPVRAGLVVEGESWPFQMDQFEKR
jgi:REP element-mobilizing transposase RayT